MRGTRASSRQCRHYEPGLGLRERWLTFEASRTPGVPARPPTARHAGSFCETGLRSCVQSVSPLPLVASVSEPVLGQHDRPTSGPALPDREGRRQEGGAQLGPVRGPGGCDPAGRAAAVLRFGRRSPDARVHTTCPAQGGASGLGRRGLPGRQEAEPKGEAGFAAVLSFLGLRVSRLLRC